MAGKNGSKGSSRTRVGGSKGGKQETKRSRSKPVVGPSRSLQDHANMLERGDIFFFYRPDDAVPVPTGLLDVNRFHVVMRPEGQELLRYITIGKKKLPAGDERDARNWGFVDGVFRDVEELRRALGGSSEEGQEGRSRRAAAVPAGEGVYALARRGRDTVLAYALELPEQPGEVQRTFNIAARGQFTVVMKNPALVSPAGIGLDEERKAEFPAELMERFGDRKWLGADPPDFLNYEGAELLLIAGDDSGEDQDLGLEPQPEDEESAEVFQDLLLDRTDRAIKPLFDGTWA